jgi:hypothetical protein
MHMKKRLWPWKITIYQPRCNLKKLVREVVTHEELLRQKERVEALSAEAKESYKFLIRICNGMSIADNLDPEEANFSKTDNLVYILKESIVDHLTSISSLVTAYEEYSKMLERSNRHDKIGQGKGQPIR